MLCVGCCVVCRRCLFVVLVEYFVVVLANKVFHVLETAVTNTNGMAVKNFVELIGGWKMFVEKLQKVLSNVRRHVLAVRWIVPYCVTLSVSSLFFVAVGVVGFVVGIWFVCQICVKVTTF